MKNSIYVLIVGLTISFLILSIFQDFTIAVGFIFGILFFYINSTYFSLGKMLFPFSKPIYDYGNIFIKKYYLDQYKYLNEIYTYAKDVETNIKYEQLNNIKIKKDLSGLNQKILGLADLTSGNKFSFDLNQKYFEGILIGENDFLGNYNISSKNLFFHRGILYIPEISIFLFSFFFSLLYFYIDISIYVLLSGIFGILIHLLIEYLTTGFYYEPLILKFILNKKK